jgi:hypothetical protein
MAAKKKKTASSAAPLATPASLRAAIDTAATNADTLSDQRYACPSCKYPSAVIHLNFKARCIGKVCRYCTWTTFVP